MNLRQAGGHVRGLVHLHRPTGERLLQDLPAGGALADHQGRQVAEDVSIAGRRLAVVVRLLGNRQRQGEVERAPLAG